MKSFVAPAVFLLSLLHHSSASADVTHSEKIREEIIVTANRTPQKISEIGSAVAFIDETEIKNSQMQFATELLRNIPGLSVSQSGPLGSATQVRIRGAEGNHTLVLIDGFDVNDPALGSEFNFADLILDDLSRIEVVKGSQTALYGSDTIGGVINFKTSPATEPGIKGTARINVGNKDTAQKAVRVSLKNDKGYALVNLSDYSTDGDNTALRGEEKDGYSNKTSLLKFSADINKQFTAEALFRRSDNEVQTDPQDFAFPATQTQGLVIDGDDFSNTKQQYGGFLLSHRDESLPLESNIRYSQAKTRSNFFENGVRTLGNRATRENLIWQSKLQLDEIRNDQWISLIIQLERLEFTNFSENYPAANYEETLKETGVALSYKLSPAKSTDLSLSLRRDMNSRFQDSTAFKISLAHFFENGRSRVHSTLGTGSTNPSFIEIFGYAPSSFEGNPSLTPEKSTSYDLGIEQSFYGGRGLIDLTLFSGLLKNEIVSLFDSQTFMGSSKNAAGQSTRKGLEVSGSLSASKNWTITSAYTFTDSKGADTAGEIRRPKHVGSFIVNYRSDNQRSNLNINVLLNGKQKDFEFIASTPETLVTLSEYYLLNAALSYDFSKKQKIFIRVSNLLSTDYSEVFSYRGPGRLVMAGFELGF